MKVHSGFFYKGEKRWVCLVSTHFRSLFFVSCLCLSFSSPVWRPSRQYFSGLLGCYFTVRRVLRIITICTRGLERGRWINKNANVSNCISLHIEGEGVPRKTPGDLTCAVCTWGDWMTDDCADWITPWTWNWPPGSCTTATEEPPSDIYKHTNAQERIFILAIASIRVCACAKLHVQKHSSFLSFSQQLHNFITYF